MYLVPPKNLLAAFFFGSMTASVAALPSASVSPADLAMGPIVTANTETILLCLGTELGAPCLMTQSQAAEYCAGKNAHLPTSRELVAFSVAFGARGVLEVADVAKRPNSTPPVGYYLVASINPGNERDDFYFSHEGYDAQRAGTEGERLWTSSIVPTHTDFAHVFYGDWGGGGGKSEEHRRNFRNAVRCVSSL